MSTTQKNGNKPGLQSVFSPSRNQYDMIPDYVIGRDILELGAGETLDQLDSVHRERFLGGNYLGIDLAPPLYQLDQERLNIVYGDIITFDYQREKFDTILMVNVIEHIPWQDWPSLFQNIQKALKPNGFFFASTRRMEEANYPNLYNHEVFGISERTLKCFLPEGQVFVGHHHSLFRGVGESVSVKTVIRFLKRRLTKHHYCNYKLYVVWRKERK